MARKHILVVVLSGTIWLGCYDWLHGGEAEVIREESTNIPAWSAQIVQKHHGPPESDAILIDLILVQRGQRKLLARNAIGPIVLFEEQRRIVSCESDGSAMVGERPIIIDLRGRKTQLPKHPGYLRGCERIERSNLLLLHYNLMADGKPYNLVRVLSTEGKLVLEKTLHESADLSVSHGGRTYRVRVAAPDLPG